MNKLKPCQNDKCVFYTKDWTDEPYFVMPCKERFSDCHVYQIKKEPDYKKMWEKLKKELVGYVDCEYCEMNPAVIRMEEIEKELSK
jgi:hypothetical protein